jgi:hypothetical protein
MMATSCTVPGKTHKSWTPIRVQVPPDYPVRPPVIMADTETANRFGLRLASRSYCHPHMPYPYFKPGTPVFTCDDLTNWRPDMTLADIFRVYVQTGFNEEPPFFTAPTSRCSKCGRTDHDATSCPSFFPAPLTAPHLPPHHPPAPPVGGHFPSPFSTPAGASPAAGDWPDSVGGARAPSPGSGGAISAVGSRPGTAGGAHGPSPGVGGATPAAGGARGPSPGGGGATPTAGGAHGPSPGGGRATLAAGSASGPSPGGGGATPAAGGRPGTAAATQASPGFGEPDLRATLIDHLAKLLGVEFRERAHAAHGILVSALDEAARLQQEATQSRARLKLLEARLAECARVRAAAEAHAAAGRAWCASAAPQAVGVKLFFKSALVAQYHELLAERNAANDRVALLVAARVNEDAEPAVFFGNAAAYESAEKALFLMKQKVVAASAKLGVEASPVEPPQRPQRGGGGATPAGAAPLSNTAMQAGGTPALPGVAAPAGANPAQLLPPAPPRQPSPAKAAGSSPAQPSPASPPRLPSPAKPAGIFGWLGGK